MLVLLMTHALAAVLAPVLVRRAGRPALYALALVPAAACLWALAQTSRVLDGRPPTERYPWVPQLGAEVALRLTTLPWLMVVLVGGIGAVVLAYSARYFARDDRGLGRFAAVFLAFAGAMAGLVLADDLVVLYVFWELTTVFSYLLIGNDPEHGPSRRAAMQALLVTTVGGLAMLVGFVMLGQHAGTYRLSEIMAAPPPSAGYLGTALALILLGALSKSAIFPFGFWLPAAMTAPTPVSAYLHAASMVKAGIFLIAVLGPAFATDLPWRPMLVIGGLITLISGAWAALRQHDLKLLLAYGTVSQLGLLAVVFGAGNRNAALAGTAMLLAHALFKAALFLVVGIIDHTAGTRDLRELSGLGTRMPVLAVTAALAAASMAGVPPLAGFVGKEAIFAAFTGEPLVLTVLVAGSALTVAYSLRFLWGAFANKPGIEAVKAAPPGWAFVTPAALLAGAGLAAGLAAPVVDRLITGYADEYAAPAYPYHLALWHGPGLPLLLTAVALAAGTVIFLLLRNRAVTPARRGSAYTRVMAGVDRLAVEVTGATQRGSLPFYVGVILVVMVILGGATLLAGTPWPVGVRLWDSPAQAVAGIAVIVAALFAARSRRRLTAMVLVGVSGYGIAVLFVLHGAPDLALTQFLVETVTIVMFVLVLRRLPEEFSARPLAFTRRVRGALALAVGTVTAAMAYAAVGGRQAVPISTEFPDLAVSYGGGTNIVNVALVDIRAWDTMGEISVLVVAATGVASLIFRRTGALERRSAEQGTGRHPAGESAGWLAAGDTPEARRQSIILQVVTRLMFHTVLLFSVYLLFSGHNAIGGGFAGGLVAGLALTVRYLAGGRRELNAAAPVDAGLVLGSGLLVAVGSGVVAMFFGGEVLQSALLDVHLPLLGDLHLATSVFFDVGVYLIVVALVLEILRSLGSELDRQHEREPA
ncbi:Na+/H+ antiporter subunit A [Actinoplanes friuliensis]|uniref:Monovalent cation/H+ antiporter subunit A n=1 Tax=Actinoplanes friuliensis DSM 7358 TaxID=1246995 RepID=U5W8M5_9ACTN|nr:Na+/H+ antiporter subunit A [Actinoplanes friuliensis]AGZ44286.1 monovalent cation/H+ antiporter subunit A [Actinoplanes friuliensis DSM 7358]